MKPQKPKFKGLSTISAFSLKSGSDRRTIQRRLLAAGIQSQLQVGRARLYRLKDLKAAAVAPQDAQSLDRASLHGARLRQLMLKNASLEFQLRRLHQNFIPRSLATEIFRKFVSEFKERQQAANKPLVEAVRSTPDTAVACQVAHDWMLELWKGMATGSWFQCLTAPTHPNEQAELDALENAAAAIEANACPDSKAPSDTTAANQKPAGV
jgi:hypothetical protein